MEHHMPELGKGAAKAITSADIADLASALECHPADLEAIAEVESSGFGWFDDGRIKILFEKHWFYKLIPAAKRANASKSGLARAKWISPKAGGYKDQNEPSDRYKLLERAIKVDEDAAYQSISVGKFQIMGFNYELCGFKTAKQMFEAFCESELHQLTALAGFLKKKGLVSAIRKGDFAKVEDVYNGGGQGGAYADKMAKAAAKLRAGKWANWGVAIPGKPQPPPETVIVTTPVGPPVEVTPPPPQSNNKLLSAIIAIILALGAGLFKLFGGN